VAGSVALRDCGVANKVAGHLALGYQQAAVDPAAVCLGLLDEER
jgi:hypothetical protein